MSTADFLAEVDQYSAHNYHPLPVVLTTGEGAWVWDVEGKKYLDCLAAYSAVNQGHRHPAITQAAKDQLDKLTLTSRAFHNDQMGPFLRVLCELSGFEKALPMNSARGAPSWSAIRMLMESSSRTATIFRWETMFETVRTGWKSASMRSAMAVVRVSDSMLRSSARIPVVARR